MSHEVIEAVRAHGIRCALTGGLALNVQLRKHGRPGERCPLNDIGFVVEYFLGESLSPASKLAMRPRISTCFDGLNDPIQVVENSRDGPTHV